MDNDFREALEKVNYIMAIVLEYMNTNYKPIVFNKHCVNCFPQCPNSRVDLRKEKKLVSKYGQHVVNEAFVIADTDVPMFFKDEQGNRLINLRYIVKADYLSLSAADKIKRDMAAKGLDIVVLVSPFVCRVGSVAKIELIIEY